MGRPPNGAADRTDARAWILTRPIESRSGSPRDELGEIFRRHGLFRNSRPGGRRAVLTSVDLSGLDLTGQDLSHADFTSASFYGANLAGCRFDCATLFACDFRQANLENASLVRADLRGCHFAGAILVGANLFSADLREGVHVSRDRKGEFHMLLPEEHNATAISGADFSGANLTNASLSGAIAIKTDFSDATMRGCKLIRAKLQGANFAGCDLAGADFAQADTRGACFRGAVLAGASFTYTDTAGADMRDTLSDAPGGRLVAELGVSLEELLRRHLAFIGSNGAEGAPLDLSGFDLRGNGSLAGACLTMATARKAVFYGLDLSGRRMQAARCKERRFPGLPPGRGGPARDRADRSQAERRLAAQCRPALAVARRGAGDPCRPVRRAAAARRPGRRQAERGAAGRRRPVELRPDRRRSHPCRAARRADVRVQDVAGTARLGGGRGSSPRGVVARGGKGRRCAARMSAAVQVVR